MRIGGKAYRTIWVEEGEPRVSIIDQTELPHRFEIVQLTTAGEAAHAIRTMQVRGAPLIGITAAYGVALAMIEDPSDAALETAVALLARQRPTAVNLRWALEEMRRNLAGVGPPDRAKAAFALAGRLADDDVAMCKKIGEHGVEIIRGIATRKQPGQPVNVLTHCNAGWLACVDWGTATSPVYHAHDAGIAVHVWVDETRPRNQGAALTAFELGSHGVPHTLIADNAGGHLMQHGEVDLVIVGTDRVTATGDVANKIGTYLKALAAKDTGVPFYVALPQSTIDWSLNDGMEIPIEERSSDEVLRLSGRTASGEVHLFDIAPEGCRAANPAFDVTPARLVTGLITERGICSASRAGLLGLYPERERAA
ncbi:MAG: S-methyl-5-thioribose-1-phosphate isomerase [Deltaproteobacteria bacterium]